MEHFQFDRDSLKHIPKNPGIYKFFDPTGLLLYVGKAKSLKNRIASYFAQQNQHSRKTQKLVSEIKTIEVTVVDSEFDALLLENNLIKENQPKYNILLKDDKTFPFLVVTAERFPKIYSTRKINKNQGTHFGPYTSTRAMNNAIELVRKLYHIRTCNLNLSLDNIAQKKFKVCLEYHIGNCLGPCEDFQSEEDYLDDIQQVKLILKGNLQPIKILLKEKMMATAEKLHFEQAGQIKDKLALLETFHSKSLIVNHSQIDIDVVTIIYGDQTSYLNYMKVELGMIRASETVLVKTKLNETSQEILEYAVPILLTKFDSHNSTILSNTSFELTPVDIVLPQIGDKKKLIDLSLKNALLYKHEQLKHKEKIADQSDRILVTLQQDLRLKSIPRIIECFDNSNIQGTNPVASMVYFKNGKPLKQQYRHYNIKTVIGPDDFASMKEIVYRRYNKLILEKKMFPDLIVIDGGKGQLSASCEALKTLGIYGKIPIIGIAKRLEELYFPDDSVPLYINKKSESLKLLQLIRDEAHRFAISFHRDKRSAQSTISVLDEIPGIGEKTRNKLLNTYKTIANIKKLDTETLALLIGNKTAERVIEHLKKKILNR